MRVILLAGVAMTVAFASGTNTHAQSQPKVIYVSLDTNRFIWPEPLDGVLGDARVGEIVAHSRDTYESALQTANRAQHYADKVEPALARLERYEEIIGDGAVLNGVTIDSGAGSSSRLVAGTISYRSGATARGVFSFLYYPSNSLGGDVVFEDSLDSPVLSFVGEIYGPETRRPIPMEGVMLLRNGDRFTGLFYNWGGAKGIYERADGKRRFIGEFKSDRISFQPKTGVVEDETGRLLAVIRN